MKIFLALVFLALTVSSVLAQKLPGLQQINSLKHQFTIVTQDTSRVLILAKLAEAYRYTAPDSALLYGQRSLSLARQIKFPKGEVNALLSISFVLRELGDFPKALETGLKALKIAEDNHYLYEEERSLIRIATVYLVSKNFPVALSYYRQAEKKLEFFSDDFSLTVVRVFTGDAYEQLNKLDSALYYEQLAFPKIFRYETLPPLYFSVLGNIQAKSGNNHLALKYYQQGIYVALKNNDYRNAAALYISIASFYKKINRLDSAIYYAKQGLAYGQMLAYKNRIMDAGNLLAELYEQKNIKESLRYYKIAAAAKDSIYSREKIQAFQTITFDEQEHQKEIQEAKTAYQNKIRQYALLAGFGVFFIIALILYRNNLYKQKANIILKKQKQKIENTLTELKATQAQLIQSEKMASLGDLTAGIAHEIQNPLNFVNNFSEVSNELLDEMKTELATGNGQEAIVIANDVKQNLDKIIHHGKRADAIVKGMLQHSRVSTGQKELTNVNALADECLRLSYHGMRAKDKSFNATLQTGFDSRIEKIKVVPQDIGRVLLNLFNNAFYAVHQKQTLTDFENLSGLNCYEPTVSVCTKKIDSKIEIHVRDNGVGIPQKVVDKIFQPFFTTKPTGQGTGLGLSLSYDIIKAHSGEIKVETEEGEGAEFTVQLPGA